MKSINLRIRRLTASFIVIATVSTTLNAQDTIYLKPNSPAIIAKILEVNTTNLKYKSYSNLEGPVYTIEKTKIDKVVYENGTTESYLPDNEIVSSFERQASQDLIAGSRIFLRYSLTEDKKNVDGNDAKEMLKSYIEGKTTCVVVNTIHEADFVMELRVVKSVLGDRLAMLVIKHLLTDKDVFKTKWVRGTPTAFYGYSGSRAAIGKAVKKRLLKNYSEIER